MKHLSKFLGTSILLIVIVLTNVSTNKSNWTGMDLSANEIDNSVHFQLSRGGTSKAEFQKLQPILNRFIKKHYAASHIKHILGEPNHTKILSPLQTNYYYNLSANAKKDNVEIVIKNQELVSYSIN